MDPMHRSRSHENVRGEALALSLHVVLLVLVLGQLVYLASRHRARFDATSDSLYSLTDSTRKLVGGLQKRLVVEAYFSPKEDLTSDLRGTREVLENFLGELVELGNGKVAVQRFNPLDDKTISDKCTRIGVEPIDQQSSSTTSVGVSRHWQGLRLVYGGGKQKVVPKIAPPTSFFAEAILTPAIKEVVTETRRKVGYMEWPTAPQGGQPTAGTGWEFVRSAPEVARRYEFQNLKDAEGGLVPDDVDTLMVFRPMDLTDRQKYVIDQFLMRGGSVVLFADVADYGLQPNRQCTKLPSGLDAKGSQWKWQEQLLHYGIDQPGQIVADLARVANQAQNPMTGGFEYFGVPMQMGYARQVTYPYFFHASDFDWAQASDELAKSNGRVDAEQAAYYKRTLRPGIDTDEFLFQSLRKFKRGPGFYWPCLLRLRSNGAETKLPEGVDGRVLLWSSPLTIVEDPQPTLNPLMGRDLQSQMMSNQAFVQKLQQRLQSEPRRQVPLMLDLKGTFPSFFAGKERPKRPSEIEEDRVRKAEAEAAQNGEAGESKEPEVGPPAPKKGTEASDVPAVVDPAPLTAATKPGRIVAFADSDFVRDDFTRGAYQQQGGPYSVFGAPFFPMLLDWLSQDSDLVALQSRLPSDRKLRLLEDEVAQATDRAQAERQLRSRRSWLVAANVAGPCVLVLLVGTFVWLTRRAQKQRFLASVGN